MIIPAGGLSEDGVEWVASGRKFFLPVKALSKVFRGVMWSLLEKQVKTGNIRLPDGEDDMGQLKAKLYEKNWNVYIKNSLAGPQSVVRYLGKYTHRVAISNNRIKKVENGQVIFSWKNYRANLKNQLLTLDAQEFIGRFFRHILPSGFYKIRYYGLLAATNGSKKQQCMALINKPAHVALLDGLSPVQILKMTIGRDLELCPKCKKGKMIFYTELNSS